MKTKEKFSRFVATSAGLHVATFVLLFVGPAIFRGASTELMGSETGTGGGIRVNTVSSIPGLDLPSPPVVQEKAAATPSKTLNPAESAPKPQEKAPAVPPQVLIPSKTNDKKKPEPAKQTAANVPPAPPAPPSNAIPGNAGGQVAVTYGRTGQGAVSFDESFGQRYGWYVRAVHTAISEKWQAAVAGAGRGSRVLVKFKIARDGTASDFELEQSSGSTVADLSARRAVTTANFPPLPREYPGGSVDVRFTFEYGQ